MHSKSVNQPTASRNNRPRGKASVELSATTWFHSHGLADSKDVVIWERSRGIAPPLEHIVRYRGIPGPSTVTRCCDTMPCSDQVCDEGHDCFGNEDHTTAFRLLCHNTTRVKPRSGMSCEMCGQWKRGCNAWFKSKSVLGVVNVCEVSTPTPTPLILYEDVRVYH